MGTNQETLIYIEDKDRLDASVAANAFAHSDVKNRVYINALGAKLGMKYLASEDIDVSNVYNIHSIKKILEEIDIADIMLSNIHIDVRVVYDENAIFIPKSHFELGLIPDIYLVLQLAKDFSYVTFLGFFEPSLINKNNANEDYYFIEKEKLSPVASLKNFITNFKGNTNVTIPNSEVENSERIIMAMADNDVSEEDKKYLIKQLVKSAELRDKFTEYESFETLSYKAMTDSMITKKEISEDNVVDFSALESIEGFEDTQNVEESNVEQELNQVDSIEDISLDDIFKDDVESLENFENVENIESLEEVKDPVEDSPNSDFENNTNGSGFSDIAGTVAGTAAGAIAGATIGGAISATAGEILNSINTTETAIDTVGEVAKAVNGVADVVSEGIDVAKSGLDGIMNNENTNIDEPKQEFKEVHEENLQNIPQEEIQEEPISLDDIDISNIEETGLPQENIENETISLNDVEISDEVNTDFIDSIDNKISFDDIDLPSENIDVTDENIQSLSIKGESISLDDIDISDLDKNLPQENEEPLISLDNTEVENIENSEIAENNEEPLEKIDELEEIDDISLDDMNDLDLENEDGVENIENLENIEDVESIENVEDIEDIKNLENAGNVENVVEPLGDDTAQETSSGFGDALMNDLTNEELEDIAIDDLGILSDENPEDFEGLDDISSNDLLSQIDDVLNASATQEEPIDELLNENSQTGTELLSDEETENPENISSDSDEYSINDLLNELSPDEEVSHNIQQNEPEESVDELLNSEEVQSQSEEEYPETSAEELENMQGESSIDSNDNNENIIDDTNAQNSENTDNDETGEHDEDAEMSENGNLEMLFSDTDTESDIDVEEITEPDEQTVPGQALFPQHKKLDNKKTLIVATALATVVAATSVAMFLKSKNNTTGDIEQINSKQNEVVDNQVPTNPQTNSSEDMLSTNAPNINQGTAQVTQTKQQVKELKNTAMNKKTVSSGSYLQVNKLVWNVPDSLAYSPKMQNYLRATGKSMKLALSTDLLSASEYAYTNQMKVNLKIGNNGDIQQATIGSSSGSTQIDNIVLQSVKDTLSAVKPPSDEIKGQSFNLALIIYF